MIDYTHISHQLQGIFYLTMGLGVFVTVSTQVLKVCFPRITGHYSKLTAVVISFATGMGVVVGFSPSGQAPDEFRQTLLLGFMESVLLTAIALGIKGASKLSKTKIPVPGPSSTAAQDTPAPNS